ncbi:TetR/AcrR family transcriptional regulator [Mycobacterium sp. NPDC048908]|uniref:TetR/AcrR family transcriptional regulator n=1 Tax=Mycobacterium sp. NPDC048908 TaxID=3364292 RepID=UPI0037158DF5
MGADSAETRARILRAARDVINERGYEAANFQAIASRAGLSRPTMHYYFHTREEIYDCLIAETYSIVADCIAQAKREATLLDQLSRFVSSAHRSGFADRSMLQFTITARLESQRGPTLRGQPGPVVSAVHAFYTAIVGDAIARGEIAVDTDAPAVVNMLLAVFLGMGFYAGYIADQNHLPMVAKQLHRLITRGLLDHQTNGRQLSIAPPAPTAVPVDELRHTWPGLTG